LTEQDFKNIIAQIELETEIYMLKTWYKALQIILFISPPLYFLLPHRSLAFSLLTAIAAFWLSDESRNLARPTYVCFYPIGGETLFHPEEKRLRVQYVLCYLAAGFGAAVGACATMELYLEGSTARSAKTQLMMGEKCCDGSVRSQNMGERLRQLGKTYRAFMAAAWVAGVLGYCAMAGRSRERAFDIGHAYN
jgi:hypothetical protein